VLHLEATHNPPPPQEGAGLSPPTPANRKFTASMPLQTLADECGASLLPTAHPSVAKSKPSNHFELGRLGLPCLSIPISRGVVYARAAGELPELDLTVKKFFAVHR
jgi:hypothetical protein